MVIKFMAASSPPLVLSNTDVRAPIKAEARDKAYRLKREGDQRDVEILSEIVDDVRSETK